MTPAEKPTTRMGDNRRTNKPIMEKRRRARINSCLNDLKALILEALKKDPSRHSKLEKADILEMTVKHLQNLHRQQVALAAVTNPGISNKFRAGFNECATEVQRYLGQMEGLDPCVRQRLVGHLTNCAKSLHGMHQASGSMAINRGGSLAPSSTSSGGGGGGGGCGGNGQPSTNAIVNGLHLVPTRLPNGDLAFLLPGSYALETGSQSMDTGNAICLVKSEINNENDNGASTGAAITSLQSASVATSVLPTQLINLPSLTLQSHPIGLDPLTMMTTSGCSTSPPVSCAFVSPNNSRLVVPIRSASIRSQQIPVTSDATVSSIPVGCLRRPRVTVSDDDSGDNGTDKEPWRPW